MRLLAAAILSLVLALPAAAQTPAIDLATWKGKQTGAPTQVLTLGSTHLGQMQSPVTVEMLAPLLDKLAVFQPEIITYEGISGEQCEELRRHPETYPGAWDTYCWPLDDGEKAVGLGQAAAQAEIDKTLAAWPAAPSSAQRRHLAALFVAAGDRPSARVQWLRLAPAERIIGDGVDAALLKILTPSPDRRNESYDIAAALAARLGLERVYPVDDHTADAVQAGAGPGIDGFLDSLWKGAQSPVIDKVRQTEAALKTGPDMLDYFRLLNRAETLTAFVAMDHQRALQSASQQNFGRIYFAWWEVRNLRMVANIHAAFALRPGARVLNVVGASHKPFYDAYLSQMAEVKLVDAEVILR